MTMKYRMLAPTEENAGSGDYSFGNGLSNFVTDKNACAQAVYTRLYLLLAEWWEDTTDGIPMWEKILATSGSPDNIAAIDLIFQTRISKTTGVKSITAWSSNFDHETRKYTFSATVDTDYGAFSISV